MSFSTISIGAEITCGVDIKPYARDKIGNAPAVAQVTCGSNIARGVNKRFQLQGSRKSPKGYKISSCTFSSPGKYTIIGKKEMGLTMTCNYQKKGEETLVLRKNLLGKDNKLAEQPCGYNSEKVIKSVEVKKVGVKKMEGPDTEGRLIFKLIYTCGAP